MVGRFFEVGFPAWGIWRLGAIMAITAYQSDSQVQSPVLGGAQFFQSYFWFIAKNLLGIILILASWPVGLALPGPGGLPMFLIGFALVSFPGKRALTTRVLRGRSLDLSLKPFKYLRVAIGALGAPAILWITVRWKPAIALFLVHSSLRMITALLLLAGFCWLMAWLILLLANRYLVRGMPIIRRKFRPWMRRRGIRLLPPRRRLTGSQADVLQHEEQEILEIHERHLNRLRWMMEHILRWSRLLGPIILNLLCLVLVIKPLVIYWSAVDEAVLRWPASEILFPGVAFIVLNIGFILLNRVITWRQILRRQGQTLHLFTAARIWSNMELARYVPGKLWVMIGRIFMLRPNRATTTISSGSQVLEMALFFMANLIVGVTGILWVGSMRHLPNQWLLTAGIAATPLLMLALQGRYFFGIVDRVLEWMGRPAPVQPIESHVLLAMTLWSMLGVAWEGMAVWLIFASALNLSFAQWPIVASAYALGWCAGFVAFWAPAGLLVRELVFAMILGLMLPSEVIGQFSPVQSMAAICVILALFIRLWTLTAELLVAGISQIIDFVRREHIFRGHLS